jgi:antitoxin component of RelBE/YafQ-DinJ toxin-antitoxin module
MDEKDIELNEELDEDTPEEEFEVEVEEDPDTEEEIKYETDEEGNVIIPDDDDDEEENPAPATEPERDPEPDPRDVENERLRKRLEAVEAQAKDTLKKMGVEEDDIQKGLAQLAAEADDTPVDEYLKKQEEARKAQEEANKAKVKEYEERAKADFEELKAAYPEFAEYKSLFDLPVAVRSKFGHFRELGLSVKEAYSAANPDGIRSTVASAAKKQAKNDGKAHLKSAVSKGASGNSITIPKDELQSWMDDLGISKEEAIKLYKKTLSK